MIIHFDNFIKTKILNKQVRNLMLKLSEPSQLEITEKLQELKKLSDEIQYSIEEQLFQLVDEEIILVLKEWMNNLLKIKSLILDTNKMRKNMIEQEKISFLENNSYIKFYAPLLQTKPINDYWWFEILKICLDLIQNFHKVMVINKHKTKKQKEEDFINDFTHILLNLQKLKTYLVIFQYAVTFDKQDIFSVDKSHERWDELRKFVQNKTFAEKPAELERAIQKLCKGIETATAIQEKVSSADNAFTKSFFKMFSGISYFLLQEKRKKRNSAFKSKVEIEKLKKFWNSMEEGTVKHFVNFLFIEGIQFHKKIFLRHQYPRLSETAILQWMKKGTPDQIELQKVEEDKKIGVYDIYQEVRPEEAIKVRVLCYRDFRRHSLDKLPTKSIISKQTVRKQFNYVIFHIHGGGFVALSSRSHQTYTRKWANQSKVPLFSVDYSKAPQCPFPEGLNDCWQTYNWILNESHKHFQISPKKKILIVGDSAGGNLILGVINLCLLQGIQPPQKVLCFYPALNITLKAFTPSFLYSLADPLLSFEFLILCVDAYVKNKEFETPINYILSPLNTPLELLKKYPPIKLLVGSKDPFHDDTLRFSLKLRKAQAKVQTIVYNGMIHGFLNLAIPGGLQSAKLCLKDSIKYIKQITWNSESLLIKLSNE